MTQPGETEGFSLSDHVRTINEHTRRKLFDWVVASNQIGLAGSRAPIQRAQSRAGARGYRRIARDRRALFVGRFCSMSTWSSGMTLRACRNFSSKNSSSAKPGRG